ncbi:hypothetical protein F5I97DRAFT_1826625 [Phlebopus sp. FC_14]|nr:hypothetical protein F5I97DRAFT_1826625 [Phlebopus sp. FC_14]
MTSADLEMMLNTDDMVLVIKRVLERVDMKCLLSYTVSVHCMPPVYDVDSSSSPISTSPIERTPTSPGLSLSSGLPSIQPRKWNIEHSPTPPSFSSTQDEDYMKDNNHNGNEGDEDNSEADNGMILDEPHVRPSSTSSSTMAIHAMQHPQKSYVMPLQDEQQSFLPTMLTRIPWKHILTTPTVAQVIHAFHVQYDIEGRQQPWDSDVDHLLSKVWSQYYVRLQELAIRRHILQQQQMQLLESLNGIDEALRFRLA